jgi:hypothetical protein
MDYKLLSIKIVKQKNVWEDQHDSDASDWSVPNKTKTCWSFPWIHYDTVVFWILFHKQKIVSLVNYLLC